MNLHQVWFTSWNGAFVFKSSTEAPVPDLICHFQVLYPIQENAEQAQEQELSDGCPAPIPGLIKPTSTGSLQETVMAVVGFAHMISRIKLCGISLEETAAPKGLLHLCYSTLTPPLLATPIPSTLHTLHPYIQSPP